MDSTEKTVGDGGPAHPVLDCCLETNTPHTSLPGMSKREVIATAAMQGIIANPERGGTYAETADDAVDYADALLSALSRSPQ